MLKKNFDLSCECKGKDVEKGNCSKELSVYLHGLLSLNDGGDVSQ
jgi:hypothetical protein